MKIIIPSNTTAEWYDLVKETQQQTGLYFDDHIESYLILTLDRFVKDENLFDVPLALEFLNSVNFRTSYSNQKLRRVGDRCLILAGLFPEHAGKVNVSEKYFIEIGQQAYLTLADRSSIKIDPKLFYQLGFRFIDITEVLGAMRKVAATRITH